MVFIKLSALKGLLGLGLMRNLPALEILFQVPKAIEASQFLFLMELDYDPWIPVKVEDNTLEQIKTLVKQGFLSKSDIKIIGTKYARVGEELPSSPLNEEDI